MHGLGDFLAQDFGVAMPGWFSFAMARASFLKRSLKVGSDSTIPGGRILMATKRSRASCLPL
jgi:hypothetical protein